MLWHVTELGLTVFGFLCFVFVAAWCVFWLLVATTARPTVLMPGFTLISMLRPHIAAQRRPSLALTSLLVPGIYQAINLPHFIQFSVQLANGKSGKYNIQLIHTNLHNVNKVWRRSAQHEPFYAELWTLYCYGCWHQVLPLQFDMWHCAISVSISVNALASVVNTSHIIMI